MRVVKDMFDEVKYTIRTTIAAVNENRRVLFKAALIHCAIMIAVNLTFEAVTGSVTILLQRLALAYFCGNLAMITFQALHFGKKSIPQWTLLEPSKSLLQFAMYLLGFEFFLIFVPLTLSMFLRLGGLFGFLFFAYIAGRLSLIFPAIAAEYDYSFRQSWRATSNYPLLMFVAVALFPITFTLLSAIVVPFLSIPDSALLVFAVIMTAANLAVVFRIVEQQPQ